MERGWKPNAEISPSCPRCGSSNTKFCYYNNYSLTQPRYFCKGCRRYWTKGGSLRNVPVGGGCRKNRKSSKSVRPSSSNDGFIPSRSLACAGVANIPIMHHSGPSSTGNLLMEPTNSSIMSDDGSNIDLALVYANYLNPKTADTRRDFENPELHNDCDHPPVEHYPSSSNTNVGSSSTLPEGIGISESLAIFEQSTKSPFLEVDKMFLSGSSSVQKHQNTMEHYAPSYDGIHFEMPPLPGEESSQVLMWSNTGMMLNHPAPTRQPPGSVDIQDADLLIGNWSPFRM